MGDGQALSFLLFNLLTLQSFVIQSPILAFPGGFCISCLQNQKRNRIASSLRFVDSQPYQRYQLILPKFLLSRPGLTFPDPRKITRVEIAKPFGDALKDLKTSKLPVPPSTRRGCKFFGSFLPEWYGSRKNIFMKNQNTACSKNARVNRPERTQVEMQFLALDQMLDKDHRARIVWQYVESLDRKPLRPTIQSDEGLKVPKPYCPRNPARLLADGDHRFDHQ